MLDRVAVRGERAVPELLHVGSELREARGVDLVDAARADGARADELRLAQHPEVLRHRGASDPELAGELADGTGPLDDLLEDRAPGRVGEGGEAVSSVRRH